MHLTSPQLIFIQFSLILSFHCLVGLPSELLHYPTYVFASVFSYRLIFIDIHQSIKFHKQEFAFEVIQFYCHRFWGPCVWVCWRPATPTEAAHPTRCTATSAGEWTCKSSFRTGLQVNCLQHINEKLSRASEL